MQNSLHGTIRPVDHNQTATAYCLLLKLTGYVIIGLLARFYRQIQLQPPKGGSALVLFVAVSQMATRNVKFSCL